MSFNIPAKDLTMFHDVHVHLETIKKNIEKNINLNKTDCRISAFVLAFLALLSLAAGAYLATTGFHYFTSKLTQDLAVFASGCAIGVLGLALLSGMIVVLVRAHSYAKRLQEQSINSQKDVTSEQIFHLLENTDDSAQISLVLNLLKKQGVYERFLNETQTRYFGTENNWSNATKVIEQIANNYPLINETNVQLNPSFAAALLSFIPVNAEHSLFAHKLIQIIGPSSEHATVFAQWPKIIAEFFTETIEKQVFSALVFEKMDDVQKQCFIDELNKRKEAISHFDRAFALAILNKIDERRVDELSDLIDKLLLIVNPTAETESLAIYVKYPNKTAKAFFQGADPNIIQTIFEKMGPPKQAEFIKQLADSENPFPEMSKSFASAILKKIDCKEEDYPLTLVTLLFNPIRLQKEEGDETLYALHPKKAANAFATLEISEDETFKIFNKMEDFQKELFLGELESRAKDKRLIEPCSPVLAKDILVYMNKDDYPNLASWLLTYSQHEPAVYDKYLDKLAEDVLNQAISQSTVVEVSSKMEDTSKALFLKKLIDKTENSKPEDKQQLEQTISKNFIEIITPQFAKQETFDESLLEQMLRWPHLAGHLLPKLEDIVWSNLLTALWNKMDESKCGESFIAKCLDILHRPDNREKVPGFFANILIAYEKEELSVPLKSIMAQSSGFLASMQKNVYNRISSKFETVWSCMDEKAKMLFLETSYRDNIVLFNDKLKSDMQNLIKLPLEDLRNHIWIEFFRKHTDYIKSNILENKALSTNNERYLLALNLFEILDVQSLIAGADSWYTSGNPNFLAMLKLLVQEANDLSAAGEKPSVTRQKLMSNFFHSTKYKKESLKIGMDLKNFEEFATA